MWSVKTLLRLSLKKKLSREGHGRDRLASNYRSFMFGKLPPPACPGLCYKYVIIYINKYVHIYIYIFIFKNM